MRIRSTVIIPSGILAIFALAIGCAEISPPSSGAEGADGPQASGALGDLPAGDDGTVGGISDIPNPSAAMATTSGKPLRTLQRGHEVFMLKCGECHYYMMPEKVDIMDWEDSMPEMIRHAGLGRAEEQAVLDYVIAVRAMHGLND
jgi:hypothetical protein